MIIFSISIFIISCFILLFAGRILIEALMRIARFLEWREFVLSFFVIAFASSIPNLFVGIISAIHKAPLLSFGDVLGGNVIDMTIAIAIPVLISKGIAVESRTAQRTCIFTMLCSVLPLILILDGILSRGDGILLILTFFLYCGWLFSKKERFKLEYNDNISHPIKGLKMFFSDVVRIFFGIIMLLIAAEGIVRGGSSLANILNLPISLISILIIGPGNALPELYFAFVSAKKGQSWMVLGDLMGAVIIPATLVLGIVSLICPIVIFDFSPFLIASIFLFISSFFFFWTIRSGKEITKKEGIILLFLFILFLFFELYFKLIA